MRSVAISWKLILAAREIQDDPESRESQILGNQPRRRREISICASRNATVFRWKPTILCTTILGEWTSGMNGRIRKMRARASVTAHNERAHTMKLLKRKVENKRAIKCIEWLKPYSRRKRATIWMQRRKIVELCEEDTRGRERYYHHFFFFNMSCAI